MATVLRLGWRSASFRDLGAPVFWMLEGVSCCLVVTVLRDVWVDRFIYIRIASPCRMVHAKAGHCLVLPSYQLQIVLWDHVLYFQQSHWMDFGTGLLESKVLE